MSGELEGQSLCQQVQSTASRLTDQPTTIPDKSTFAHRRAEPGHRPLSGWFTKFPFDDSATSAESADSHLKGLRPGKLGGGFTKKYFCTMASESPEIGAARPFALPKPGQIICRRMSEERANDWSSRSNEKAIVPSGGGGVVPLARSGAGS